MKPEFHGILLDVSFKDPHFLGRFKLFAKRKSVTNPWVLHGVVVPSNKIDEVVREIQANLIPNAPYYGHFYRDSELIVVFKNIVFRITPNRSTWQEAIEYGRSLGIPDEQLVFEPNKVGAEDGYFGKENFLP